MFFDQGATERQDPFAPPILSNAHTYYSYQQIDWKTDWLDMLVHVLILNTSRYCDVYIRYLLRHLHTNTYCNVYIRVGECVVPLTHICQHSLKTFLFGSISKGAQRYIQHLPLLIVVFTYEYIFRSYP